MLMENRKLLKRAVNAMTMIGRDGKSKNSFRVKYNIIIMINIGSLLGERIEKKNNQTVNYAKT